MKNKRLKHALIPLYQRWATLRGGIQFKRRDERPTAFVLLAPDYGNIGDLAIGVAQHAFLERLLPGYNVVSIPLAETYAHLRSLRRNSKPGDLIFLVGGGNTGDLYPRAHFGRNFIVQYLHGLPIISFPQSVIYSSPEGRRVFGERERRAFRRHPRLRLFAREQASLNIFREIHGESVGYAPDIVLSFHVEQKGFARDLALMVLRNDSERLLTDTDDATIRDVVASMGLPTVSQDHEVDSRVLQSASPREVVDDMLDRYRRAKIVITDRLHGMIFAAITGTPCVVLPNTNQKIIGTYEAWLRDRCPYIEFAATRDRASIEAAVARAAEGSKVSSERPELDFGEFERTIVEYAAQSGCGRNGAL
ncbi:polysaccharide pyruvyl transferase family protein [Microbacterium esteraromaticum]|uniref:polysaccharide pyruvyl transferase family protein n=1 Tax=Microbacterium esteraromaticum TaxID=57043 RepID=UPI001C9578EE|nr:polysaccharide pyruvyl transferase family protein [Microbacterium esteraromaticum]MBY6060312.1 polysaccharide pyruvyl transferase family protein [Microbacterium esteraromaticum]